MGGIINKVTGSLGLTADPSTGSGQMQQASELQHRAVRELEKLGVPAIEAQKLVLEQPELVLSTLEEKLGPSALEDIQIDPRLAEAEMESLGALQEAGREGFTAEDRARIEAVRSQIGADEQARQATILQQMAQRGSLDSGAQLAAQLGSSQAATQRASQEGIQLAAQSAAARRGALAQAAQTAGQMGTKQFGQQAQQAQARDAIQRFNAAVSSRDTGARQQQAQQKAQLANQQQMFNKGLVQQQYQNQLAKATGITGALGNQAQQAMQSGAMQAQAAQQQAAGTRGLLIGGAQAAAGFMADGGIKKDSKCYQDGGIGPDPLMGALEDLDRLGAPDPMNPLAQTQAPLQAGLTQQKLGNITQNQENARKGIELANQRRREEVSADAIEQKRSVAEGSQEGKDKNKFAGALEALQKGSQTGAGETVRPASVGNINPNDVGAMMSAAKTPGSSKLDEIRKQIMSGMAAKDGGTKGMNYQAGGEGTIIDSGQESFIGDDLEDRINDGEMVLNVDQQEHFAELLKELAQRRRGDEALEAGDAQINEQQQDTLMSIARGEAQPEDLMVSEDIIEPSDMSMEEMASNEEAPSLEELLGNYQDGGISIPLQRDPIYGEEDPILSAMEDLDVVGAPDPMDPLAQTEAPLEKGLIREDLERIAQNQVEAEKGIELAGERRAEEAPVERAIASITKPAKKTEPAKKPSTPDPKAPKSKEDKDLKKARMKDIIIDSLGKLDNALAHYDAANPNAMLTPIQKKQIKSDFESKLVKSRQIASEASRHQKQLDLQMKTMESAKEEKQLRRQERQIGEARRLTKDQINTARGLLKDDPRFKKAVEQGMEFESVDRLLGLAAEGNQAAVQALGTKLARAMGEVGVLTDTDVVRYVGGTSWGRKLKDWYTKGSEGELSEDTLKDIHTNLKLLKSKLKDDTNRVYENAESRMSTAYPQLETDTIKGLLGTTTIGGDGEAPSDSIKVKRKKDGKIIIMPKDKAQRYLSDPGFEEVK